ncbi:MAG: RluA family pseudouridine synthase [Aquificae bacterium]|nr:RluA family pseudouridine synthase [Aquificota bacterium]
MEVSEVLEFKVGEDRKGERLDRFLSSCYTDFSRSYIKKLIEGGNVLVDGKRVQKPSLRLKEGQSVTLLVPKPEPLDIKPEDIPIEVVYEDKDIAVVVKPCGLVVHPSPGYTSGTLVNALLHRIRELSSVGGVERPGIVHRLDKETAGLLVVAKSDKAHRELVKQFQERKTEKHYKVLVKGIVREEKGVIDKPIGRHPVDRKRFSAREDGKEAITEYRVLKRYERFGITLLDVKIHTGRTHQIRVHFSSIGHPVLGDTTYGFKKTSVPRELIELMGECNMLVAYKLGFTHPTRGEELLFEIPEPETFRSVHRWLEEHSERSAS